MADEFNNSRADGGCVVIIGEYVLIGGTDGTLYPGTYGFSLDTLKQHLPEIAEK